MPSHRNPWFYLRRTPPSKNLGSILCQRDITGDNRQYTYTPSAAKAYLCPQCRNSEQKTTSVSPLKHSIRLLQKIALLWDRLYLGSIFSIMVSKLQAIGLLLRLLALFGLTGLPTSLPAATFTLTPLFSHYAVLQQGQPLPIWGTGAPETEVTISLSTGEFARTVVGKDGNWTALLPPLKASKKPLVITATQGAHTVSVEEVLIGEVWVVAGSAAVADRSTGRDESRLIAGEADEGLLYPIRTFRIPPGTAKEQPVYPASNWLPATTKYIAEFGHLGIFFARELSQARDVPIGIIEVSHKKASIGAWIPARSYEEHPGAKAVRDERWELEQRRPRLDVAHETALATFQETSARPGATDTELEVPIHPLALDHPNSPGSVYRAMVAPLIPYGIRGVLWDHGTIDSVPTKAASYDEVLGALVDGWRSTWKQEGRDSLPFLAVQAQAQLEDANNVWALPVLRDSQRTFANQTGNSTIVVSFEVGDPKLQYPHRAKIAKRAALVARGVVYKEEIAHSGPTYQSMRVDGTDLLLEFDHGGGGLISSDGTPLRHFSIADRYKGFFPAEAAVEGESTIRVSSPHVTKPVAVRYAWSPAPERPNLANKAGHVAGPFRTDDRELRPPSR